MKAFEGAVLNEKANWVETRKLILRGECDVDYDVLHALACAVSRGGQVVITCDDGHCGGTAPVTWRTKGQS